MTTAHVLTEVSNWIGFLPRDTKIACLARFRTTFSDFLKVEVGSLAVSGDKRFPFLGLMDAALARFAGTYLVLTDGARFVAHRNHVGFDALNINHLRQEVWLRD